MGVHMNNNNIIIIEDEMPCLFGDEGTNLIFLLFYFKINNKIKTFKKIFYTIT